METLNTKTGIGLYPHMHIRIGPALALLFGGIKPDSHHCKFAVFRREPRGQNEKGCP